MMETTNIQLNPEEKRAYEILKDKLLLSTHPEEVRYYENEIHKLLDKAEMRNS